MTGWVFFLSGFRKIPIVQRPKVGLRAKGIPMKGKRCCGCILYCVDFPPQESHEP
jgi:hypothetical protein